MENITLTSLINPQPKQLKALQNLLLPKCKYLLYGGSMGGGKSYLLRWGALSYLLYLYLKTGIRDIPVGLFSEDYPTLKDRQVSRIEREFPQWLGQLKETKIDGLAYFIAPEYGSGKLLLRNLDDPAKYMSTEFAGEFVEELTRNKEQTFMDLRNRLRYPGIDEVKFMGASNPGGIGHGWVRKYFIDKNSGDLEQNRFFYVHANAYDNKYISEEYIKQLEALPEQQRKAYLEGSWDIFAGQYFTEWRRDRHIIPPFIPSKKSIIVGGMDWGRTKPFAFHLSTIEKVFHEQKSFYRCKTFFEVHGIEKKPSEWSDEIKEKLQVFNLTLSDITWVRADPSIFNKQQDGSKSIRDQFIDADKRWYLLHPANNDRIQGWNIMRDWLSLAPDGKPYWQVTSNNESLIITLPALIHDENIVEDVETTRKYGIDDDDADAMRYQLKHIKWVDGKVGAAKENQKDKEKVQFFARIDDEGKQLSINPNRFLR